MRRRARLVDVAEAAGVSIAAASRALSGAAGIRDDTAARVRAVAARMGYVTNEHARALAGGESSVVGLLVHEITDPYFAEIAGGVLRASARHDLTVQIGHTGRDSASELAQIRMLAAQQVRAIIIAGSGYADPRVQAQARDELAEFQAAGGRVSVIGRQHLGAADAVLPDNVAGGRAIVAHLVQLGHRRIAFACGSRALTTVSDRLTGAAQALADVGVSLDALPVVEEEFTRAGGLRATRRILDAHPDVTAIAALSDDMAIGALTALRDRGTAVPGGISVVGFDDVAVAAHLWPALTTVRFPMSDMGEQVLEMAIKPPSARPRRRHTSPTLVVRDSTAAPNG